MATSSNGHPMEYSDRLPLNEVYYNRRRDVPPVKNVNCNGRSLAIISITLSVFSFILIVSYILYTILNKRRIDKLYSNLDFGNDISLDKKT